MAVRELNEVSVDQLGQLDDEDLVYLLQRNRLYAEVTEELKSRDKLHLITGNHDPVFQMSQTPNYGNANTVQAPPPRTRQQGEEDESYLDEMQVDPRNLTKPQLVGAGVEDEDDDEFDIPEDTDYESEDWNNDKRRAELQRRAEAYDDVEVDLGANKAGLIEQLEQLDADGKR